MSGLSVSLLGPLQITRNGVLVGGSGHEKARALFAYLVMESDRPHRREVLSELFWPDQPEGRGRHSLRQALVSLRQMIGDQEQENSVLLTTRDSLQIHPDASIGLDVAELSSRLQSYASCQCGNDPSCLNCLSNLEAAIELYRGDFLTGLALDASPEFDEWVVEHRERLRLRILAAAFALGELHVHSGDYLRAIDVARYQLALDDTREDAHRQLMLALYLSGDRRSALAQFDHLVTVLDRELGVEPDDETLALRDAIRDQTISARKASGPRVQLPVQTTPFIGREPELADIAASLQGAECRLLTLSGPGGSGKTRLAIEAASRAAGFFRGGVTFVPLAGVFSYDGLVATLADTLFPGGGERADLEESLLRFVQEREMLIVLDNFEQLVSASSFVADLLTSAPSLQVLVTTRERLNLYEECVFDLDGLRLPDTAHHEGMLESDAARLFIASAQRANSRFTVDSEDSVQIGRICRLVDGLPLALELAAASTPVLSCAEIAAEIEHNLDILASSFRNVPDRHRSIRAVFDRSWDLLASDERHVFSRLSVFRGGFDRRAAEYVAGASISTLSSLVSKSLIRRSGRDRYEMHELLHQYGDARLSGMPDERRATARLHSEYYCSLLFEHEDALRGHGQEEALLEMADDLDNLRIAWRWAAEHQRPDLLMQAAHGLWIFLEVTSRYYEAEALFGLAADQMRTLHKRDPESRHTRMALASMLVRHGAVFCRLGESHLGEPLVEEGCSIARELNAPHVLGLGLNFLGMYAIEQGDYRQAEAYLQESIGRFRDAGDHWGEAYSTNDLSMVVYKLGNIAEAGRLLQLAIGMFSRMGDKRGLAFALHNKGVTDAGLGRYREARESYQKALEIRRALRHSWAVSMTLTQLGVIADAMGDSDRARMSLVQALQVASEVHSMPAILAALTEIAVVILRPVSPERARDLLLSVRWHPATDFNLGERVDDLLAELGIGTPEPEDTPGWETGIEQFTREVLASGTSRAF